MKKTMLLLTILITTIILIGCDFFSKHTTTLVEETNTGVTFEPNPYLEGTPNTDDVDYDTLFDDSVYKKFTLYFSEENFKQLIENMIAYDQQFGSGIGWGTNYRDNTIQEVDIVYEDGTGNIMQLNEVGFRTKGNIFSRFLPAEIVDGELTNFTQTSFQLEFNNTFEYIENSTEYNFLQSREAFDLEQLNFKYIRSGDFGVVTESVAYDMFRSVGVYTSNTSYAIIYFDIEGLKIPYGLFMLQEPIDDEFVRKNFGENEDGTIGDVYKCTWQQYGPADLQSGYQMLALGISDYTEGYRKSYALKTNKTDPDFTNFIHFIDVVNNTEVLSYYETINTLMDVDNFAKASALHFLVGSPDDYRSNANNYYMYLNEGTSYYMPFDFDNAMGNGWNPYGDYGISLDVETIQPSNGLNPSSLVLIYNLMNDETFRDMYIGYLDLYSSEGGVFDYQTFEDEFNVIQSLYYQEIQDNSHLGIGYFTLSERYESMTPSDYFSQKKASVRMQLDELDV